MSLQRGENIRGWGGVTDNIATNSDERGAWTLWIVGLLFVALITGLIGLTLSQADIPVVAKAIMMALALLGTLVLLTGIYSSLVQRARAGGGHYSEPVEVIDGRGFSPSPMAGAASTHTVDSHTQQSDHAAAEAAAQAAEQQRAEAAARAAEEQRAQAEAAARAEEERKRAEAAAQAAAAQAAAEPAAVDAGPDRDGDGVAEGVNEGTRPAGLDAPMDGKADDLKLIKGVGPKLEDLCNRLGFYHFSQIASWSADEIAWVDSNLEGFNGRVTRDDWVAQAKILAAGGETEFSSRQSDA